MSNIIERFIDQVKNDDDFDEATAGELIGLLEAKRDELGPEATDDELQRGIRQVLMEHLASSIGSDEEIELDEDQAEYMKQSIETVKEIFEEEGWHFSERSLRADLQVFEAGFGGSNCRIRMKVTVEANPDVCRFQAILPITAESIYAYPLCEEIVRFNYPKRFGALQYDERDGEICYEYSYPIGHGINKEEFKTLFLAVISSADDSYETMRKCCVGKFKRKEVREILLKVNDLVNDLNEDE